MGENTSIKSSYTYNGTSYASLSEMPPEVRVVFEDKDESGIPDFVEKQMPAWMLDSSKTISMQTTGSTNAPDDSIHERTVPLSNAIPEKTSKTTTNTSLLVILPILLLGVYILYLLLFNR